MTWLRRLLSAILLLMLVPVLSSIIVVSALSGVYGVSGGGAQEATAKAVAAAMKEPVVEAVTVYLSDSETGWGLPADEVRVALNESLGDEQMVEVATSFSVAMEHVSTGEGPAVVRLGDFIDALLAGIRRVVERHVAAMPVCTKEQTAQLAAFMFDDLPDCRAADPAINRAVLDRVFAELRAEIPNEVDLGLLIQEMNEEEAMVMPATAAVLGAGAPGGMLALPLRLGGLVSAWGWLVAGVLVLGLVALNLDRWYRPFGWIGWAFLLSSATPLLLGAAAPALLNQFSGDGAMAARIAESLLQAPLARVRVLGLIAAGLGIACIVVAIAGALINRSRPPHQTAT